MHTHWARSAMGSAAALLGWCALSTPAAAASLHHRVGLAAAGDWSYAWKTDIHAGGGHGGVFWSMHGAHAGLQVEVRDQVVVAHGVAKNLPGLNLSYAHLFGERSAAVRGYAAVGVDLYVTDLLPVMPFGAAEGGAEWRLGDGGFLRAAAHAFFAPAPALGVGPRSPAGGGSDGDARP